MISYNDAVKLFFCNSDNEFNLFLDEYQNQSDEFNWIIDSNKNIRFVKKDETVINNENMDYSLIRQI